MNRVVSTLDHPGSLRDIVWQSDPFRDPADIELVIAWCTSQGLDARAIPHPDGLVVSLDSPDGGLTAYVVEVVFEGDDPYKNVRRYPDGQAMKHPVRRVPVTSIPPGGGLVPRWALNLATPKETRP